MQHVTASRDMPARGGRPLKAGRRGGYM